MSDLKPQSRFRLASKESHQPTFPVAGPIPNHVFLGPLEGGIAIELQSVEALAFEESIALGELSRANLSTTGYDDPELMQMAEEEAATFAAPPMATQPQKITMSALPPAKAKPIPGFEAVAPADLPVTSPRLEARTIHTKFAFGPNPNKPKPAPAPAVTVKPPVQAAPPPAPAPAVAVKPPVQAAPPPAPAPAVAVKPPLQAAPPRPAPVVSKPVPAPPPKVVKPTTPTPAPAPPTPPAKPVAPSITVKSTPPPPPPAPIQQPAAAAAAVATPAPAAKGPEAPKIPEKLVEKPVEKPAAAAAPEKEEKAPERPKINVRPPAPVQRPQVRTGNAVPAERPEPVVATPPPPATKPKVQPIRPESPGAPGIAAEVPSKPAAAAVEDDMPSLRMPAGSEGGSGKKMGIIAAVALVAAGGGYFLFLGGDSKNAAGGNKPATSGPALTISDSTPPNMIIGGGGWATNWGNMEPVNKGKNISLFRPTINMPDYRIEFRGQVENKALGWVFRAKDPKNYYVMKIEMIKRGLNPVFALVKYAVINGKENTHTQIMLEGDYRQDNVWRVRQDVRGNKFTTYVQDKLADYWTDDEIKTGGAGFYNDKGEFGQIKLSTFSYLPAVGK